MTRSVMFRLLPQKQQESNNRDENDGDSDWQIKSRIAESRNKKTKRPSAETCLLCMQEAKKMTDHLASKNTICQMRNYAILFRHITAHSKLIVDTNVKFALSDLTIVGSIPWTTQLNAIMIERMFIYSLKMSVLLSTSSVGNF